MRLQRRRALGDGKDRRVCLDQLGLELLDVWAAVDTSADIRQDARRRIPRDVAEFAVREAHGEKDVAIVVLHHIHRRVAVVEIVIGIRPR